MLTKQVRGSFVVWESLGQARFPDRAMTAFERALQDAVVPYMRAEGGRLDVESPLRDVADLIL